MTDEEAQSLYEFEGALADMARDLLAQESVQATAERIVHYAVQLVDGCDHAGILLLHRRDRVETAAATSDVVRDLDRAQEEVGEGPCFDAAQHNIAIQRLADLSTYEGKWPQFAPYARDHGMGSMLGLLLYTEEDELGALDLYSAQPNALTERSERVGWLLASHAAVMYAAARRHDQLTNAMQSRKDIGEALGLLMATHGISEEQAFQLLTKVSQDRNVKLRQLAREINSGELPIS